MDKLTYFDPCRSKFAIFKTKISKPIPLGFSASIVHKSTKFAIFKFAFQGKFLAYDRIVRD